MITKTREETRVVQSVVAVSASRVCLKGMCLSTFGLFQLSGQSRRRRRRLIHPSHLNIRRIKGQKRVSHTIFRAISTSDIHQDDEITICSLSLFVCAFFFIIIAIFFLCNFIMDSCLANDIIDPKDVASNLFSILVLQALQYLIIKNIKKAN